MNNSTASIVLVFLIALMSMLCTNCSKDYSYEGGIRSDTTVVIDPPDSAIAAYTLTANSGSCSDPGIRGTYLAYRKTGISDFVELLVNVTLPGSYSISTDTIDGISFSATGFFTSTGPQRVSLKANGVPLFPQNLLFTSVGAATTCFFPLTVVTPGFPATYVLESSFDSSCTGNTVNGKYTQGKALAAGNMVSVKTFVTVAGNYTIASNTVNGISFNYTGLFTDTGNKLVNLQGNGIPVAKGTFTYQLRIVGPAPIGGASCIFSVTVN